MRRILCFFGFHQWIPISFIWVKFHSQLYHDNKYAQEGEQVVKAILCPVCKKQQNIKAEL